MRNLVLDQTLISIITQKSARHRKEKKTRTFTFKSSNDAPSLRRRMFEFSFHNG